MRFTDTSIKALNPRKARYEAWDDRSPGFGLRVGTSGKKAWIFLYRFDGRPRRMTLGTFPAMGLADAGLALARAKKLLDDGADPGAAMVGKNHADRSAPTISVLIEEYLVRHARPKKRTAAFDERVLRREVESKWGSRKANSIRRRDVILLLDDIQDRGSPVLRNRLQSVMSRMFNVGLNRDIVDVNPVAGIERCEESPRERVLSADEVKALWLGLPDANMTELTRLALKFLLVTGVRRQEVTGARRDEIDDHERLWTIPSARTKAKRAHVVPLSPLAMGLIELIDAKRHKVAKAPSRKVSEWLFPSPLHDSRPITPPSITRALSKNLAGMGVENITPHDFRRVMATTITTLGISRFVAARVLNHADGSVTGKHYDMNEYVDAKRSALEAWAAWIEETVSGGTPTNENVVNLRAV